jgi:hypothetical protein
MALKNVQYSHDKEFRIPLIKKSNCGSREKQLYMLVRGVHPLMKDTKI